MLYICGMKKTQEDNPFLLDGYEPGLFCDRVKETALLINNGTNRVNTTLLSIRRMGKTGLLHHTLQELEQKKKGTGIYMDIFDTENLRDFINRFASSMLQAIPQ